MDYKKETTKFEILITAIAGIILGVITYFLIYFTLWMNKEQITTKG